MTYQSNCLSREYGKGNVPENFFPAKGAKNKFNLLKVKNHLVFTQQYNTHPLV